MDISIIRAVPSDVKQLIEVYDLSFYSDYIKYGECPGYHRTEENVLYSIQNYNVYKIIIKDKIIGAISVQSREENFYYIGALCVIPEFANKGIGKKAMAFLDEEYPDARHWALDTPSDKFENHYFYKKFNYEVTKEYMSGNVLISYFERWIPRS